MWSGQSEGSLAFQTVRTLRRSKREYADLLQNRFYEAPAHLAGETVEARFDPLVLLIEIYFQVKPEGTARLVKSIAGALLRLESNSTPPISLRRRKTSISSIGSKSASDMIAALWPS